MATNRIIKVGLGTCGISAGAKGVYEAFAEAIERYPGIELDYTSCNGSCYLEPIVEVWAQGEHVASYHRVKSADVVSILESSLSGESSIELIHERRLVLENCGQINPDRIEDYKGKKGYQALRTVLTSMTPKQVVTLILSSGLRGRGGAGFSTGTKWELARRSVSEKKFVICNADEGDPGAFMDRSVLEGDPHRVLEGLAICAYAIGAHEGYIYVRAEYPLAVQRIRKAIEDAKQQGILGDRCLGLDWRFSVQVKEGAGAFVCGEETALMASIEGKRGMPTLRPPYPAVKGLWGHPTNINNVETLANIPWIIRHGAEAYAAMGTTKSKGTKVFSLAGKVAKGGLVEVEMGLPLRTLIETLGGGTSSGKPLKAVQLGGPSGGCVPASLLDTRVDYEELVATGAIMGSGGVIIMDEETCMVEIARFFLAFTQKESCGKCTFCRIGTKRMLEVLERITAGKGVLEDLVTLRTLAQGIGSASLCQLGRTAPNPVLTTLKYFEEEYREHIEDRRCRAGFCKAMIQYTIDEKVCTGCTVCARNCPVHAITGERKLPHVIDLTLCTKCGTCQEVCPFGAVSVGAKRG
ncbi:MAG: NADH-quinone oxidoreductase subunit NuoF [Candidatus Margulisiibacteriota bacterium]